MDVEITIKNYRCFADEKPATFALRSNGFTGFVGVNNSGKSSLLKMFFELRHVFQRLQKASTLLQTVREQTTPAIKFLDPITDKNEIFHYGNERDITLSIKVNPPWHHDHEPVSELRITIPRNHNCFGVDFPEFQTKELNDNSVDNSVINVRRGGIGPVLNYSLQPLCHAMHALSRVMYIGAFRNAINVGAKDDYFDIQIGESFTKVWQQYKTGPVIQRNAAAKRVEEDIRTIFAFDSFEINPTSDGKSLHLFIDGKPFKLSEVGGGIAQFIVVLANVAIHKPSLVLIDEPELNLHPTLQMEFLTTMASLAEEGCVAFSTHSYGLARTMADPIYSVRMNDDGASEVGDLETTPRWTEFLGELTFSGYQELGFNGVLLVEGRTDVKVFRQFLRMHDKDHLFVIISLGGNDGISENGEDELLELRRITSNVKVIIDSERNAANDPIAEHRQAFKRLCDAADMPCTILERRATENYLAEHAIKRIKGDKYECLGEFGLLKDAAIGWGKHENWRIAREMRPEDLKGTDLGEFLASL